MIYTHVLNRPGAHIRSPLVFRGSQPVLVIETIEKKYDSHGDAFQKPQLVS